MSETTTRTTYKYRLDLTPAQAQVLETVVWRCRELYNAGLQERNEAWERYSVSINYYAQATQLPAIKVLRPEYGEVYSQVLQEVLHRLEKAFQAFFRRVQAGEKPGYPRFQGRDRYHSFTYPQYGNGAVLDGGLLNLSKIGRVRIRLQRPMEGRPKTVTISHEADGWYACIVCDQVPIQPMPLTGKEVGIDVGIKAFYVDSHGNMARNPKFLQQAEVKLRRGQRKLARCQQGSKRRQKVKQSVSKQYQTVKRQRLDFHHKETKTTIEQYDVIYLEDLQVQNMVKNHHLAKSISDAGWAQFRRFLEYKAACAGKQAIAVPPHYTSQVCSRCGAYVQKSLGVRTHACPVCGLILVRDHNSALEILGRGQRLQRVT